ncbi:MAG TPA: acetyl-CoA carboxylase biotin carboxyl carrier protein subunit [bacterium]|nr:acetyl-CoA carboxylase biotin carboxyl carrier protein subunit [bacterium]
MKIQVGGSSVHIERIGKDRLLVNGKVLLIDAKALKSGRIQLIVDGRPLDLQVHREQGRLKVLIEEESISVQIETSGQIPAGGMEKLHSRMPGKVLAVNVKPGDAVAPKQSLLVLEAMKMENEILAPAAGIVDAVFVQAGEVVGANQPLIALTLG